MQVTIQHLIPPAIIANLPNNFTDARQVARTRVTELQGYSTQLVAEQPINADLKSFVSQIQKIIDIEEATIQRATAAA